MGADQSKTKRKLDDIDREVTLIRSTLRDSSRSYSKEMKNNLQENLIKYSNEASELKGRVKSKQLDSTQKNISKTMREVLTLDSDLDKAAIETDSIVQVPQTRKTSSLDRQKKNSKSITQSKSMPSLNNSPNLQDIENKLKTLRSQIKVSLQSEDTTQLRVYQETLKVLATSLELIDVPEYTPIGDKKKKLENMLTSQYQTIVKALKEIRRNRDIKYLSNLKQKESTMKELEVIRRDIEKYDSLTREAFKAGDKTAIREVQQNLKEIRQRLNSVNSVDENTKTLKFQMKDKISWLGKFITESAQKGSQPDLTKAQSDYEDIIKNIASGRSKSEIDLKEKLQSLQSFTSLIDSLDEDNVKKKTQLLNNINKSLTTLHEDGSPKNRQSGYDINQRNLVFERKMLENFLESWQILKNALHNSNFPTEIFHQIDNALNEVQISIEEARQTLRNGYEVNSNSVTNETAVENLHNLLENSKIHQEEKRFSKINEIKTQVYYIKEKFETSIQKPNIKLRLQDYVKTLEEYVRSDNEVIANNAKILLADIYDIIRNIDDAMSSNDEKLSAGYYSDIIMRMEGNVAKLEKSAKNFQADRNDTGYQDTKNLLNEIKINLNTLDIPNEYDTVINHKLQVSQRIEQIIDHCERESFKREEAYVKEVNKTLDSLKDRVNRFTGPYKGVLYNALEKDLNKILVDADANISDTIVLGEIIKDTERSLNILEQRALKDQNFQELKKTEDNEKMSSLKEELQSIKNDIDVTPMNAINIFIGLNSRLDLIKLSLDQLKNLDDNGEHQKGIICNEIETQKNVVEAKIALGQQDMNQTSWEEFKKKTTEENNRRITEELDKIELTFGKLKQDITNFVGTKSDKKYYELDESTLRLIVKMDDLKLAKGTQLYDRKVSLLKEIHQYEDLLETRTRETEDLLQFESDLNDIENNFSKYAKSVKDLENLNKRINNLKENLKQTKYNTTLQNKKKCCFEKMNNLEIKVKTRINENILFEENLLQIKYSLEVIKKNINKKDMSSSDVSKKISSIRTELLDMRDLNSINLEQRTNLLKELEALEKSLESKEVKHNIPITKASSEKENKNNVDKEILEIEQSMRRLKNEIGLFVGTSKDDKFCELNEGINKLIMNLDDTKFDATNSCQEKKRTILRELNQCSELFDKRVEDTEKIVEIEEIITDIEKDPVKYSKSDINDIFERLQKTEADNNLNDRKSACLQKLTTLLRKQNEDDTIPKFSSFVNRLTELENMVDNFSGTSSDTIFLDIESNLNKLLAEVQNTTFSNNNKDNEDKSDLLEEIANTKIGLKKKAEENKIYSKFTDQLEEIKNQISVTTSREAIMKMHNKLKFIQSDVEKTPLREKLKNDIHRRCTHLLQLYSEKINSLPITSYIGSIDFIKDLERNTGAISKSHDVNLTQDFDELTKRIDEINVKVTEFSGSENSDEYKNLEDELLKMNIKIKKLVKNLNDVESNKKKIELKEKVVNCLTLLDEKAQDFEKIEEVEKEFEGVIAKLKSNMTQIERDKVDEKLISLQLRLGKLSNLNKYLAERKNIALHKIVDSMKKIKQMSLNSNSEDSGTSI